MRFFTTFLWYPYWLFAVLGVIGTVVVYISRREEDKALVQNFSDEYEHYERKVRGNRIADCLQSKN